MPIGREAMKLAITLINYGGKGIKREWIKEASVSLSYTMRHKVAERYNVAKNR